MYAVVRTGGKQYRVTENDVIVVERLLAEPGDRVELDQVLMMDRGDGTTVGSPLVEGARIAATVLDQAKTDKILVFKKKRRKNYRRIRGHRQNVTVLRVTDILMAGETPKPAKAATPEPEPEEEPVQTAARGAAGKSSSKKKVKTPAKKKAKAPAKKKKAAKRKSR